MNEKDFEMIRTLEETGNITKAADLMFVTQSALTKKIQTVEKELGTTLMIRSRQGIRFTNAGEIVAEHCKRASAIMDEMRTALENQKDMVCGTLKLGASMNYATYCLPDILASYHQRYPNVKLQLSTGHSRHLYRQMLDGELDVAVLRGEYQWDGMRHMLLQENMCVICAKQYEFTPLSDYPYISRETDPSMIAQMMRWMKENDLNPHQGGFSVDSLATCMELAQRGLGWAIVPEIGLHHFRGSIRRCTFEDGEPFVRRTWLLAQPDSLILKQVAAFVEHIKRANAGL